MTDVLTEYDLSNAFSNGATIDWSNKKLWSTGTLPNDNSALVVFQTLTDGTGAAKSYTVEINSCESFSACTIDMLGSKLLLAGGLSLLTGVNVIGATAEIEMQGGKLSANTLHLAGSAANTGIIGAGSVSVSGDLFIQSTLASDNIAGQCRSGTLTVSAGTLVNWGAVEADSGSILVVGATSFTNYSNGTLSQGSWEAIGGTLDLRTPGLITTDNADIVLNGLGSAVNSLNASGKYVALQSSLATIGADGSLEIDSMPYVTSLAVTDKGSLTIDGALASFTAPSLTIAAGGTVTLSGDTPLLNDVINVKQLVNNGIISVESSAKTGADIVAATAITGGGSILLGDKAAVELTGSVANDVDFSGAAAKLILDSPKSMTGTIEHFGAGDQITLTTASGLIGAVLSLFGIGGGASPSVDYSGDSHGGTLTIHQGSASYKLAFEGDYSKSSFHVTSDAHGIEIVGVAGLA